LRTLTKIGQLWPNGAVVCRRAAPLIQLFLFGSVIPYSNDLAILQSPTIGRMIIFIIITNVRRLRQDAISSFLQLDI